MPTTTAVRRDHTTRNKTLVLGFIVLLLVLAVLWVATTSIVFFWLALVTLIVGVGAINGLTRK